MPPSGPRGAIPWDTDFVPYTRDVMRAFADPNIDTVVFMVAAQCGKTEVIFNVLGWLFCTRPKPAMYVAPTEKLCRTLSRDRLDDMLRSAPQLWAGVDRRYAKPGSMERWIHGARLGMAWAGSPVELVSHPVHTVMVDERSVMDLGPSRATTDPVRDAKARTKNYTGSKVGVFSTPTDKDSCPTYAWWRQGTKHRWCWLCTCGEWFAPELQHLKYDSKAEFEDIRQHARIHCPACDRAIGDDDRKELEADYVPHTMDEDGNLTARPGLEQANRVASYWVTGFASPFLGIGVIAEELARAARQGTPADVQSAVNQYAGELFEVQGDRPPWTAVLDRARADVPFDVQLVTAGVDVQMNSVYYVVRGWGYLGESFLLDYGELQGATEYDDVWRALQQALTGETFAGRHVDFALIDSGFQTHQVYEWCRRVPSWSPSKGLARDDRPFKDSTVDESATGRARKTLKLWHFSADTWKVWLYGKIRADREQLGGWWVPEGVSERYCQQVTNEKCIQLVTGRRKWVETGMRDNHYLDCEVNAAVAAHIRNVRQLPKPKPPEPVKPAISRDAQAFKARQERINNAARGDSDPFSPRGL